jgi:hypothetical protein
MQTCSKCHAAFEGTANRPRDISWKSLFTRPPSPFPLGEDIELFALATCPKCGHTEKSHEFRIFGFIPGSKGTSNLSSVFSLSSFFCLATGC